QEGSVHRADWPTSAEVIAHIGAADPAAVQALDMATWVLGEVRRTKSEARKPLRTPVVDLVVTATPDDLAAFERGKADVLASGFVQQVRAIEGEARSAVVVLGELEPTPTPAGGVA